MGLVAVVLTLAAAFFFAFTLADLVAAGDSGLDFLGPAISLVAVTFGCEGTSVTSACPSLEQFSF